MTGEESFNGGNVAPGGRLSFVSSLSGGEIGVRLSSVVLLGANVGQDPDEVDGDALPSDGGNESCSLDPEIEGIPVENAGGAEPGVDDGDDGTRLWTTMDGADEISDWGTFDVNKKGAGVSTGSVSGAGSVVGVRVTTGEDKGVGVELCIQHRCGVYSSSQQPSLFCPSPFRQHPGHRNTSSKQDGSLAQGISVGVAVCMDGISVGTIVCSFDKLGVGEVSTVRGASVRRNTGDGVCENDGMIVGNDWGLGAALKPASKFEGEEDCTVGGTSVYQNDGEKVCENDGTNVGDDDVLGKAGGGEDCTARGVSVREKDGGVVFGSGFSCGARVLARLGIRVDSKARDGTVVGVVEA